ncbi:MAG: hypothetical protein QM747_20145, partial [Nocardioides sp.]
AVCPGNHDVRDAYVGGMRVPARDVVEVGGYRFVMLDSLVDAVAGERVDEGRLGPSQLEWLDEQLASSSAPTFVCLHHPPTTIGLELMDPIRLMDGDDLAAVLERHPHVVATLVGHAHTMATTTYAGRPLLIGGGVASTVTVDAEDLDTVWYAGRRAWPSTWSTTRTALRASPPTGAHCPTEGSVASGTCCSPSTPRRRS